MTVHLTRASLDSLDTGQCLGLSYRRDGYTFRADTDGLKIELGATQDAAALTSALSVAESPDPQG